MTLDELKNIESDVTQRLEHLQDFLHIDDHKQTIAELEEKMTKPDFWDNKESAQETVGKLSAEKAITEPYGELLKEAEDFAVHIEFAADDPDYLGEAEIAAKRIMKHLDDLELLSFLNGALDKNGAYVSIHAGAGGTESCDWASILMRMYRRYFEIQGWKDEIMDITMGEEAGVKSVTMLVQGNFAYGYMKCERGVHRLVRISPFDSNARRHTSFCSVEVYPEVDDDIDIEIDEKDLRIDTYRSSGKGGQGVNTTDSAVRLTHLPTGLVAACQSERSQHKNKATAMKMLKARLYELEENKRREAAAAERGEQSENGWGSQIRSYVLQPYQMVKDLRTGVETSNTAAVLDGEINEFIESYLKGVRISE
ncbi:MAG: peptide chain release factor 2 [Lentisphaeria bacterium]|nr:peptide chain release factor 2 [Lentisphaeria bacterium]